jgi:hypothetical protein
MNSRVGTDLESSHRVVKYGSLVLASTLYALRAQDGMTYHQGNMVRIVHLEFRVVEELFVSFYVDRVGAKLLPSC